MKAGTGGQCPVGRFFDSPGRLAKPFDLDGGVDRIRSGSYNCSRRLENVPRAIDKDGCGPLHSTRRLPPTSAATGSLRVVVTMRSCRDVVPTGRNAIASRNLERIRPSGACVARHVLCSGDRCGISVASASGHRSSSIPVLLRGRSIAANAVDAESFGLGPPSQFQTASCDPDEKSHEQRFQRFEQLHPVPVRQQPVLDNRHHRRTRLGEYRCSARYDDPS